jgi:hypothetical protein
MYASVLYVSLSTPRSCQLVAEPYEPKEHMDIDLRTLLTSEPPISLRYLELKIEVR